MIAYLIVLCYTNFDGIMTPLRFIRTDTQKTPYVTIDDNFYTQNDCTDLLNQINNSGLIVSNPLNDSFEHTKGFLLQFINNSHLQQQFQQHNAGFLYNIFTKIKNPKCNAFICNVLIIPARNKIHNNLQLPAIDLHHDCTINITETYFPNRTYLPKCVSVLYIQTPNHFTDGELELYTFMGFSETPQQIIKPKIGRLVIFRGDLLHAVKSFESNEDTPRVSLVFEQYMIPSHLLPTKTFEFLSKKY
jgi:hypothetical protein